uniref:Uncharacterized protein n=1 Tax=Medicago truncatula TaxID=3880 RepID=A2Q2N2_MEDTR|nr:hypothetical protein MtrDRAFT_AC151521g40v2 [Medicago truncatula]
MMRTPADDEEEEEEDKGLARNACTRHFCCSWLASPFSLTRTAEMFI